MSPSRRRATARCAAWHPAHAESFACRGSVRGTVRGRAAHPARCYDRAAIYPREIRTRITRAARWGHRALPPLRTPNSHAHYPARLGIPCPVCGPGSRPAVRTARGGSPPPTGRHPLPRPNRATRQPSAGQRFYNPHWQSHGDFSLRLSADRTMPNESDPSEYRRNRP